MLSFYGDASVVSMTSKAITVRFPCTLLYSLCVSLPSASCRVYVRCSKCQFRWRCVERIDLRDFSINIVSCCDINYTCSMCDEKYLSCMLWCILLYILLACCDEQNVSRTIRTVQTNDTESTLSIQNEYVTMFDNLKAVRMWLVTRDCYASLFLFGWGGYWLNYMITVKLVQLVRAVSL